MKTRSVDVCGDGGGRVCLESRESAFHQLHECSTNIITKQLKRDFENYVTAVLDVIDPHMERIERGLRALRCRCV